MRVDDFPPLSTDLERFKVFDAIMKRFGVPYLLGVIPYPCLEPLNPKSAKFRELTKAEIETLHDLKDVELAMHGVTHQTRNYGYLKRLFEYHSEFEGLDWRATSSKLKIGLKVFKDYGLERPRIFVPPFNRFDEENMKVFEKYFRFITGGPETKKAIKKREIRHLIISDGLHYGHSYSIFVKPDDFESDRYCCVTLHWGWEIDDDFSSLKKLLAALKGNVENWSELKG